MEQFWESEKIFLDGDQYFDELLSEMELAKKCITIEMYMFSNDAIGNKIADSLISAHKRGVSVEIVVDGIGSWNIFDGIYNKLTTVGIKIKLYNPLPFLHPYYGKLTIRKKLEYFLLRFWKLNRRNHRKVITIDEWIMFTGSYNFTIEHTHHYKGKKWKDMGIKVTGKNVLFATLNFKKFWKITDYYRTRKSVRNKIGKNPKTSPLRLSNSLLMKNFYYRDLIKKIEHVEKRIWFITPYFIPKGKIIKLLAQAALKGADVRLLISYKTDIKIFKTLQYFYYPYLIKNGVKIFQYTETVLHAKNFIIDDWMTIGSSNLNHRSLLHDLEIDLVIQKTNNQKTIENHFIELTQSLQQITDQNLLQRSMWEKLLSQLYFLFRNWF